MSTASVTAERRMSVAEFLVWAEQQGDEARHELVGGEPVRLMAPTSLRHAQVQRNASDAIRQALQRAGLSCRVYDAGPGVAVGQEGDECRIPGVVVTCAPAVDETARLVPEPVLVVEVASPSTRRADVNDKVEFYGRIASVRHYLVIEQDRRRVVHFSRSAAGGLEPRLLRRGSIELTPPGIELAMAALYRETVLAGDDDGQGGKA